MSNVPQILEKVVLILDSFSLDKPELGVREVARKTGLSSSTAGRLLVALKELGLVNQNAVNQAYSLGSKSLAWAGVYGATQDVRNLALPIIHDLHRSTSETISLYIMEGNDRVCIERLESQHNVRIVARIGRRLPLYAGSAGRVFLAFLPNERCKAILDRVELLPLTEKTFTDREKLEAELERVRVQGYAVSEGEWILEASGVAAPVFDMDGSVVAALTISGPAQRFDQKAIQRYASEVKRNADEISRLLGFIDKKKGE